MWLDSQVLVEMSSNQPSSMTTGKAKRQRYHTSFWFLELVGEEPYRFAGRSLRIGGATLAFAIGAPATDIMLLGDWVSEAVFGYNQPDTDLLQSLPRRIDGRSYLLRIGKQLGVLLAICSSL